METLETFLVILMTEKSRCVPSKFWFFTWNEYPNDVVEILLETFTDCKKYVFQKEIGESGTPHIQGCIECLTKIRPIEHFQLPKEIHWEKTRNREKASKYCCKCLTRSSENYWSKGFKFNKPIKLISDLFPWQQDIVDICKSEPDDRKIYWYWEEKGCTGKTALCKYLYINYGAILISGNHKDVKNCIVEHMKKGNDYPEIILVNLVRGEAISYKGLESVKDGIFYSGKYEGGMCVGNPPHVFVFSNTEPNLAMLSEDRWVVNEI